MECRCWRLKELDYRGESELGVGKTWGVRGGLRSGLGRVWAENERR